PASPPARSAFVCRRRWTRLFFMHSFGFRRLSGIGAFAPTLAAAAAAPASAPAFAIAVRFSFGYRRFFIRFFLDSFSGLFDVVFFVAHGFVPRSFRLWREHFLFEHSFGDGDFKLGGRKIGRGQHA